MKRFQRLFALPERQPEPIHRVPRRSRPPTSAERAELVAGYRSGLTLQELAARFGFHRETVSIVLDRAGVERRYHEQTVVDLDRANELHRSGLSITEVAEAMGIGRATLIKARRRERAGGRQ